MRTFWEYFCEMFWVNFILSLMLVFGYVFHRSDIVAYFDH